MSEDGELVLPAASLEEQCPARAGGEAREWGAALLWLALFGFLFLTVHCDPWIVHMLLGVTHVPVPDSGGEVSSVSTPEREGRNDWPSSVAVD